MQAERREEQTEGRGDSSTPSRDPAVERSTGSVSKSELTHLLSIHTYSTSISIHLYLFCDGNQREGKVVFSFYCIQCWKMVAQDDAMITDKSGSRICSTMCALIGSAVHCVFVIWRSNHKLLNVLSHKWQPPIYWDLCVVCVHWYAKMAPQPLTHECVTAVCKMNVAIVIGLTTHL